MRICECSTEDLGRERGREEERKERWEQGQADYMGADSFDNIKRKLDTYLQ